MGRPLWRRSEPRRGALASAGPRQSTDPHHAAPSRSLGAHGSHLAFFAAMRPVEAHTHGTHGASASLGAGASQPLPPKGPQPATAQRCPGPRPKSGARAQCVPLAWTCVPTAPGHAQARATEASGAPTCAEWRGISLGAGRLCGEHPPATSGIANLEAWTYAVSTASHSDRMIFAECISMQVRPRSSEREHMSMLTPPTSQHFHVTTTSKLCYGALWPRSCALLPPTRSRRIRDHLRSNSVPEEAETQRAGLSGHWFQSVMVSSPPCAETDPASPISSTLDSTGVGGLG